MVNIIDLFSQIQKSTLTDLGANQTWSGIDLVKAVGQRADQLLDQGIKNYDRVIILHNNTAEFFFDLFAIWKIGASAIPLDPSTPITEVNKIAEHSLANFKILNGQTKIAKINDYSQFKNNSDLILYTSGTSGTPKAVVHSLTNLVARINSINLNIPTDDVKRSLCLIPTYFGHGLIGNSLFPLCAGQSLFISPVFSSIRQNDLISFIDENEITFMSTVPSLWKLIDPSTTPSKNSLRRIHSASSPFSQNVYQKIKQFAPEAKVFNVYGMTELASWVSGQEISDNSSKNCVGSGWNVKFKIENRNASGIGEVCVSSDDMKQEYWNSPDLTSQKYIKGWFKTGDLGRLNEDNSLELLGRSDDVIDRAGLKVFPLEVENVILNNPDVQSACVFSMESTTFENIVCAAYVLKNNSNLKSYELENWVRQHLPAYRVPSKWYELTSFPFNSRGKVVKNEVVQICKQMEDKS